jgi:hypothetical protein
MKRIKKQSQMGRDIVNLKNGFLGMRTKAGDVYYISQAVVDVVILEDRDKLGR